MNYSLCYILWAGLYALTAALGFLPEPTGGLRLVMQLLSAAFFVPGFVILLRAKKEDKPIHRRRVRNVCLFCLAATVILMVLNLMSVNWSQTAGDVLYVLLILVSAPMVCCQSYVLGLFGWSCLLMAALKKK